MGMVKELLKRLFITQWQIDLTVALYRFMCGSFDKNVPKPYYGNYCGPFWAVFFTYVVPVLTPFVLLAVVVRLIFGKRQGEKLGSTVISYPQKMVAMKMRAAATGLVITGLLAIPIVLFWAIAWQVLASIGITLGMLAPFAGLFKAIRVANDRGKLNFLHNLAAKIKVFWDRLPKQARLSLISIGVVITSPVLLFIAILVGFAYGIMLAYENACPIVRESVRSDS